MATTRLSPALRKDRLVQGLRRESLISCTGISKQMMDARSKQMKLYHRVDRVFNELRAMGLQDDQPIPVEQLCHYDQYHYFGTDAVDEAIDILEVGSDCLLLEVGAGIGGPSRYLAHRTGCRVTALEIQPDVDATGRELTRRCRLDALVEHRCGDILKGVEPDASYDAIVSWLAFLHIPDRATLYRRCFEALRPGGRMLVEDYFERGVLSADEKSTLAKDVWCDRVPTMTDYRVELSDSGFENIRFSDMTTAWTAFVADRFEGFHVASTRNRLVHGDAIVDGLHAFYETVLRLFEAGNLGGIRFSASKPA